MMENLRYRKNLSENYELNEILNPKGAPYSLAVIRNNIYEDRVRSKTIVENLSVFSFMQNRVRFIEYQILNLLTQQTGKLKN